MLRVLKMLKLWSQFISGIEKPMIVPCKDVIEIIKNILHHHLYAQNYEALKGVKASTAYHHCCLS